MISLDLFPYVMSLDFYPQKNYYFNKIGIFNGRKK
jgi:hypothetical protein